MLISKMGVFFGKQEEHPEPDKSFRRRKLWHNYPQGVHTKAEMAEQTKIGSNALP